MCFLYPRKQMKKCTQHFLKSWRELLPTLQQTLGQSGRLFNTRMEEHKNDVRLERCYKSVLVSHTKEFVDVNHVLDWDKVEILHGKSNERQRKFMEMLYIQKQKELSIRLKTDLDWLNKSYSYMINHI